MKKILLLILFMMIMGACSKLHKTYISSPTPIYSNFQLINHDNSQLYLLEDNNTLYIYGNNIERILAEVIYDPYKYTPQDIVFLQDIPNSITTSISTKPGNIGLASIPINHNRIMNGTIVKISFDHKPFRAIAIGRFNHFYDREQPKPSGYGNDIGKNNYRGLQWREVLVGDGDYNGEVSVTDISPLAINYLMEVSDNPSLEIFDYDTNGTIGVPDITPIAFNYLETIDGYNVYYDTTPTFSKSTAILDGQSLRVPNPQKDSAGFILHTYEFNNIPEDDIWYYFIVPYDTEYGEATNIVSDPYMVQYTPDNWDGSMEDSIFLIGPEKVGVNEEYSVYLYIWPSPNKPVAHISSVEVMVDGTYTLLQSISAKETLLPNYQDEPNFFDSYWDSQIGSWIPDLLAVLPPAQQPDGMVIGINWGWKKGQTPQQLTTRGVLCKMVFKTNSPRNVEISIGPQETYYVDLQANLYTFETIGKDYGNGITNTIIVSVDG